MTIKIITDPTEAADMSASKILEGVREDVISLTTQMDEQGMHDAKFVMQLVAKLAVGVVTYASFIVAGTSAAGSKSQENTDKAIECLLNDLTAAANMSLEKAKEVAAEIDQCISDVDELLKRTAKKCH